MATTRNRFGRREFLTGAAASAAGLLPRAAHAISFSQILNMAEDLKPRLEGYCAGYQFTISRAGSYTTGAGGECRRQQDSPSRVMSPWEKYNTASVSKAITATTLMRVLWDHLLVSLAANQAPKVTVNSPFVPYLPAHWTVHDSLRNVTFRQLLRHESGFRFTGPTNYAGLKGDMEEGISPRLIGTYDYNNRNFAIMRLLIPRLANYNILSIVRGTSISILPVLEAQQAEQFALSYIDCVQKTVWDKINVAPAMACKPTDTYPALCYQFPLTAANGGHFGDMTLTCADRGWHASSFQLSKFMETLHTTTNILPASVSNQMASERLGFDTVGKTATGVTYWAKGGYYPDR